MTYCESGDLLLGNVPVPSSAEKYIEQAADEIDSYLGSQYVTPVILDEANPKYRSGSLLLKRLNIWLASGRLLMALDAAGEDDQVHQYAERLVNEALAALKMITDGSIIIPGAEPINPEVNRATGPLASWADDASAVETFDSVFGNPAADVTRRQTELPYSGYRNYFDVYTF